MRDDFLLELERTLLDARADWERRLEPIRASRRRASGPLDRDFEDQAIQRENDDVLDALDARGHQAIESINAALDRLAGGTFGDCAACGERISIERLRARPTATTCASCASSASDVEVSEEGTA